MRSLKFASLTLVLFFIFISVVNSQDYLRMMESDKYSVSEIRESAEKYFSNRDKGRGSGYNQFKRWEYNALRMMDENGYLKSDDYYSEQWERMNSEINDTAQSFLRTSDYWSDMGPDYFSASTAWSPGVGRITSFFIHPDNEDYILVGAESGGIWKSLDRGKTWSSLTDNFSNLVVESIVMHPDDDNIVYFGSSLGRIYRSTDTGVSWTLYGTAGSSRVRRLLINPDDPTIMFACSQNAGIYRSADSGKTWSKVSTDNYAYDIVFKPGDLNTLYASGYYFQKSTDGGKTFKILTPGQSNYYLLNVLSPPAFMKGYNAVENAFGEGHVPVPFSPDSLGGKLVLFQDSAGDLSQACGDAANSSAIAGNIAVIRRGECYFVDKVFNAQKAGAVAVIIVNKNPGEGSFAMSGSNSQITIPAVMITKEDGDFLIEQMKSNEITVKLQIDSKAFNAMKISPKAIAVSPANPDVVYLMEADGGKFSGFFKSVDSGESFTKLNHPRNYLGYSTTGSDDSGQAPRNMELAVNPFNANEVHLGGIQTWHSFDGGLTFICTSDWVLNGAKNANIGYCHADINRLTFYNEKLYCGTDGGFFRAKNTNELTKDYYEDLTPGLGIRHFYKIGVSQTSPVVVSGGSQDNGTSWYTEAEGWKDWIGADGMESFIDKYDPDIMYGTIQYGGAYRKEKSGSLSDIPAPDEREGNWVTPFEKDPVLPNTIYIGYEAVYKSSDRGSSWTQISQEFSYKLNHLKIAESNNKVMYAAAQGELYKTTTGGGTWEKLSGLSGSVNSIAIHPKDPDKIAIASTSVNKVFVSYDGGKTWKVFLKNLPNFSALAVVWQDDNVDGLYLGMNYGVFYINNTMTNWIPYSTNLPNVIINELEINYAENKIYAGTYGRGLWSSPLINLNPDNTIDQEQAKIKIYPNPAKDHINLVLDNDKNGLYTIEVYNLHGKRIRKVSAVSTNNYQMNLSEIPDGSYFVRVSNKSGRFTGKFEIVR
jgi:photosystem II stability/assembly factor-like uncharacterized protein